jgi:hypothetical protein
MEANLVDDSDNVDDSPELASENRMSLKLLSSPDQQATEEKRKYLKKEN